MQKQVLVIGRRGSALVGQMWLAWTVTSVGKITGKLQVEWAVSPVIVIQLALVLNNAIKWVDKLDKEAFWNDVPVLYLTVCVQGFVRLICNEWLN